MSRDPIQAVLAELIQTSDASALEAFLHAEFLHHRPGSTSNKARWLADMQGYRAIVFDNHGFSRVYPGEAKSKAGAGASLAAWRE